MKINLIPVITFAVVLVSGNGVLASIQVNTSSWQDAVNQEIPIEQERPIEQEVPVKESPIESKGGENAVPQTPSLASDKTEMKSFDPFTSDKPDSHSSLNTWNPSQRANMPERDKAASNLGDRAAAKSEDTQSSILSFNLMLNWLNKFKTNQEMQ